MVIDVQTLIPLRNELCDEALFKLRLRLIGGRIRHGLGSLCADGRLRTFEQDGIGLSGRSHFSGIFRRGSNCILVAFGTSR